MPGYLAGRDLEEFQVLIPRVSRSLSERSIIYSAIRGVGKTVLLIEFDTLAREGGWVSTDVHEGGSQADFPNHFFRPNLGRLPGPNGGATTEPSPTQPWKRLEASTERSFSAGFQEVPSAPSAAP